jgi:hypothetical protein
MVRMVTMFLIFAIVLGENMLQRYFVHHKSHMTRPGFEPGPPRWEASD